jgi:DNA primase
MDVIDFIMYYESLTKRQAIEKARYIIGHEPQVQASMPEPLPGIISKNRSSVRTPFLENMFTYFKNAVSNSQPAQDYIQSRGLSSQLSEIGYNSGQFHHGSRKDDKLINDALEYGLLIDQGKKGRTGEPAYKPFGKGCICFALRDKTGKVASLYFRSIFETRDYRHYYLKDRQGLYPCYPDTNATRLILTESIIDAATLLEQEKIRDHYTVLAFYGTNGLTGEHKQAIGELAGLEEIILFLDGDEAGANAIDKYLFLFKQTYPDLTISKVDTPLGQDINSLLQSHTPGIFIHLLDNRTAITIDAGQSAKQQDSTLLLSAETASAAIRQTDIILSDEDKEAHSGTPAATSPGEGKNVYMAVNPPAEDRGLDTTNPYNLKYTCGNIVYQIKGFKSDQADSLKVTLQILVR